MAPPSNTFVMLRNDKRDVNRFEISRSLVFNEMARGREGDPRISLTGSKKNVGKPVLF